jgi:hypothetical protein
MKSKTHGDDNSLLLTCYSERQTSQQHCHGCQTTCWFGSQFDGEYQELHDESRLTSTWCCVCWWYRSPDFTPLDIFLWDHLKSMVHNNLPWSIAALQHNTHAMCSAITPATLQCVHSSLNTYYSYCTNLCGVPYTCVVLWTCNILPQLATLQHCFYMNILNTMVLFTITVSCCTCLCFITATPYLRSISSYCHHITLSTLPYIFTINM